MSDKMGDNRGESSNRATPTGNERRIGDSGRNSKDGHPRTVIDPNFNLGVAKKEVGNLVEFEQAKRATLRNVTDCRDRVLAKLLKIQEGIMRKRSHLKQKERTLSSQAGQLLKGLKGEEVRVNKLSTVVNRINKQRKQELSKISEPSWASPHHYHMTSIEHATGHTQPHVMDVGSMIRGHLRIYAMANSAVRFQRNAAHVLSKAKNARLRVSDQIKKVYRELRATRSYIKENERMLDVIRPKLGDAKISFLKTLNVEDVKLASEAVEESKDSFNMNTFVEEEEKEPGDVAPIRSSHMSPPTSTPFAEEVAIKGNLHRYDDEKDEKKKRRPPSLHPPRVTKREQIQQPASPRPGSGGYRNIKMRFFQALNLGPPVLKDEEEEEKGGQNTPVKKGSVTPKDSRDGKSQLTPGESVQQKIIVDDWALLKKCFDELEPLDKAKQAAWEELEQVLEKRERLVSDIHKNGGTV